MAEADTFSNADAAALVAAIRARRERLEKKLDQMRTRWWGFPAALAIGGAIGFLISLDTTSNIATFPAVITGAIFGPIVYVVTMTYVRLMLRAMMRALEVDHAALGAQALQDRIEENFFTKLVQINFKYIDQYYLQTQEQANKSFLLSMFAAVAGLAIIVAGIVLMYQGKTEPAYVSTAAGVLGEFVSAVFFYLYNKTILKMSEYHQKLVITQNISLALKIAEGLPEADRATAQKELIGRLTDNVNRYLTQFASPIFDRSASTPAAP